jgi:glutamyl-tRNA synthetase
VLGPDGQRLAKRHGSVTLADRASLGESPQEVRGWMAQTLGLAEIGENPTLDELLDRFDLTKLPKDPTIWSGE